MLKGHSDGRTGTARRAAAHRIHYHQDGAGRCKKLVNLLGSSRLLHAVLDEVGPHWGNELFVVRQDPIVASDSRVRGVK